VLTFDASRAYCSARSTFSELPEVEMPITTSPGLPKA
jgi:hypothetical protein